MAGAVDAIEIHLPNGNVPKDRPLTPVTLVSRNSMSFSDQSSVDTHVEDPAPLRPDAWDEPSATSFEVRGRTYLRDKKKVSSSPSFFRLLTVDLVQCNKPVLDGLCKNPNERIQMALAREKETGIKELPSFIFAVNIAVPGPPCYHMVAYFGIDDEELAIIKNEKTPPGRLMNKFFFGHSDEFRDNTFKLIPRILEGNFMVKKAVGKKPSILGRKIKQYYLRDENKRYFELVVDIGSEYVAEKLTGLGVGYARSLIVDMMFLLEGTDESTLPEQILGGVRLIHLDFKKCDGRWIRD